MNSLFVSFILTFLTVCFVYGDLTLDDNEKATLCGLCDEGSNELSAILGEYDFEV